MKALADFSAGAQIFNEGAAAVPAGRSGFSGGWE